VVLMTGLGELACAAALLTRLGLGLAVVDVARLARIELVETSENGRV
jgi:hypothetical protein